MGRRKMIGLGLIVITCLFVFCCVLLYVNRKSYKIERGMSKALETYSNTTEPIDIKVLSKEINELVEEKLKETNLEELSEEELQQLLEVVADHLREKIRGIGEEERYEIANQVIAQIIELGIGDTTEQKEQLEEYKKKLEQLTNETNEQFRNLMDNMAKEIKSVQEDIEKTNTEIEQQENTLKLQKEEYTRSTEELRDRTKNLEDNVLFHSYDEETNTLQIFGKKEEELVE